LRKILTLEPKEAINELNDFEKELRELEKGYSSESDGMEREVAKANPIFKAGIEAGHRSIYWLQGYIQAIYEILGEENKP